MSIRNGFNSFNNTIRLVDEFAILTEAGSIPSAVSGDIRDIFDDLMLNDDLYDTALMPRALELNRMLPQRIGMFTLQISEIELPKKWELMVADAVQYPLTDDFARLGLRFNTASLMRACRHGGVDERRIELLKSKLEFANSNDRLANVVGPDTYYWDALKRMSPTIDRTRDYIDSLHTQLDMDF